METTSHRPWETTSPTSQLPSTQTLPSISTLTSKLPPPSNERGPADLSINPPPRDSGSWMSNSALTASSTHSNPMPFLSSAHSPTGPGPSPFSPDVTSAPASYRNSQNEPNGVPSDSNANRGSGDFDDSRRSSATSGIHQGMHNLVLGPTSPYHSNNHSQSSLTAGLQQQRGITSNGYTPARYSTMNGPISPYGSRGGGRGGFIAGRVAPPILENPKYEVYSAEAPTRGQAYAFPDPDARPGKAPSTFSRRNSFADSFTSSVLTVESSRLPPGQHELPEAHHHTLVNKQIDSLRNDPDSPNSTTPYSRTPELRVTHKLAERKRRSEMKDCFEQLRARLPASQNNKSSKWETLARAIEYITSLETEIKQQRMDSDKQRHQLQDMEHKMQQMNEQLQRLQHQGSYPPPPTVMPRSPTNYNSHYSNGIDGTTEPARTLPPLMNGAMQGVQYSDDRR